MILARVDDGVRDLSYRPSIARPIARPRLARGATIRGNTPWERWEIDEPDGRGGLSKKVVGVQTHIDTSAAGFTATPNYFATLETPSWELDKAELAPAFFPQLANQTVDGFTFRLLMAEIARRRYPAATAIGRVSKVSADAGGRVRITLEDSSMFRKLDAVALLRPRGSSAVFIEQQSGVNLTLAAPIPASVEPGKTVLALGNAPRTAKVTSVAPANPGVLVSFTAPVAIKKNDILVRLSDSMATLVGGTSRGRLKVQQPFPDWKPGDRLGFAPRSGSVEVKSATATEVVLSTAAHEFDEGALAVHVDKDGEPLGGVSTIKKRTEDTIHVEPPLSAATLLAMKKMSLVRTAIVVTDLQPQSPGSVVKVGTTGPFSEGDFVVSTADRKTITTIEKVDQGKKELTLRAPLPLPDGASLVAANWLGSTTVNQPATSVDPLKIEAGRADAVPVSAFVVARDGDGFEAVTAVVKAVSGTAVTLETPLPDLQRLDTLAIGMFPGVATVVVQEPDAVRIAEAGALKAGDMVIRLGGGAVPGTVASVQAVTGNAVTLQPALDGLQTGDQLGVVHYRDTALLASVNPGDPAKIKVDRSIDVREGDLVAPLTHYADNSASGYVQEMEGSTIVLYPAASAGDGIADRDWIDGGILGLAAVAPYPPSQPLLRLESTEGVDSSRIATVYGLDLLSGQFLTTSVYAFVIDAPTRRVYLSPSGPGSPRRYRPETMSLVTTFNADFAGAFATFAQRQQLAVCWTGCQNEFPRASECPAAHPAEVDPCAEEEK
ncbi:MAG: hypothetical protein R2762_02785 [Bryobacteraceae bacterium]